MKKILLSILLVTSVVYAEPTSIEQQINQIDIQIKKLQDEKKFLEAQLVGAESEKVLEEKEVVAVKEEAPKEKGILGFTTHTELGYIKTSGNTDTVVYNIDSKLKKEWGQHILTLDLQLLYGEEDSTENKNKFFTELNYYYKFTDRFAVNYLAAYKEDKFSGFENQIYTGPGAVYKAIDLENHALFLKANALFSRDEVEDTRTLSGNQVSYPYPSGSVRNDDGYTDEYISYKAQVLYKWNIFKNLQFSEDFNYRSQFDDGENFFIYSKTALSSKLSDMFSVSLSYQVDYINEAADGKDNSDKTTMFNLIVDY